MRQIRKKYNPSKLHLLTMEKLYPIVKEGTIFSK